MSANPTRPSKGNKKTQIVELDDDDDDEALWASMDRPSKPKAAKPSGGKPARKAAVQEPIEIESDDIEMKIEISDSDDEVQQKLVLLSQGVRKRKV